MLIPIIQIFKLSDNTKWLELEIIENHQKKSHLDNHGGFKRSVKDPLREELLKVRDVYSTVWNYSQLR